MKYYLPLNRITFQVICIFIFSSFAFTQDFCPQNLVKYYDLGGEEAVWSMGKTDDSFAYIAGSVSQNGNAEGFLFKTDFNGTVIWTRLIRGLAFDEFRHVTPTRDSGCITVGYTAGYGAPRKFAQLVCKWDKDGNLQWSRVFNTNSLAGDIANGAIQLQDGGYLIYGTEDATGFRSSGTLIRTDRQGTAIWIKKYVLSEGVDFTGAAELNDGFAISADFLVNGNTAYRLGMIKVNKSTGSVISSQGFNIENLSPFRNTMLPTPNGLLVSCPVVQMGSTEKVHHILEFNLNLDLKTAVKIPAASFAYPLFPEITLFPDGSVGGVNGNGLNNKGSAYKFTPGGNILWSSSLGDDNSHFLSALSAINNNNLMVAGIGRRSNGSTDLVWARLSTAANQVVCGVEAGNLTNLISSVSSVPLSFDNVTAIDPNVWTNISVAISNEFYGENFSCPQSDIRDFSFSQDSCDPYRVTFNYQGASQVVEWIFGDGSPKATGSVVTHRYSANDNYKISLLTTKNNCGFTDTLTKQIRVAVEDYNLIISKDTAVCAGQPVPLRSLAGETFCWTPATYLSNPNSMQPTAQPPSSITYRLLSKATGVNLVTNGNFSSGNSGFSSEYNFAASNTTEGEYFVGTSPAAWNSALSNCGDKTTGTGNMLLVNGAPTAGTKVWTQSIAVIPNTNYEFSVWLQALWPPNPAQLQFSINDVPLGTTINATLPTCTWTKYNTVWNSGANTNATISVINRNTAIQGNDFALDDISFAPITFRKDSVRISINKLELTASADTSVCIGSALNLYASGAVSYEWSPATNLSNVNVSNPTAIIKGAAQYLVIGKDSIGCSASDTVNIGALPLPTVTINPGDTTICLNSSIRLEARGGLKYSWTPAVSLSDSSVANPVATPQTRTTYTVYVTDTNGCSNFDSVVISLKDKNQFSVFPDSATSCLGAPITLSAFGGTDYLWEPSAGLSSSNTSSVLATPLQSTVYSVRIIDANCKDTAFLESKLFVRQTPLVEATHDTAVCRGGIFQLSAVGADRYSWSPASAFSNPAISNPTTVINSDGRYIVTGTDSFGCTGSDTVDISALLLPTISILQNDTLVCSQSAVALFATGGVSYNWNPAQSLNSANVANPVSVPTATTQYTVTGIGQNGCSAKDSIVIEVKPRGIFTISPESSQICAGASVVLRAGGGDEYWWQPGTSLDALNGPQVIASPSQTITYSVRIADSFCKDTATLNAVVSVEPPLPLSVSKSNDVNCNFPTAQLLAVGGVAYQWEPAAGLNNPSVSNPVASPVRTTTYRVTAESGTGCKTSDSVTVMVSSDGNGMLYQMPSAFTPNGDGLNDCFGVSKWGAVQIIYFNIYDRWGKMVFAGSSSNICWDGSINGVPQQSGNYIYKIQVETLCGVVSRAGSVVLIR